MPLLAYGAIDDELEILYGCMVVQTVGVLAFFFLSFMESITITSAHNMLDPRFKRLKCVIDFLGHDKAKLLIAKYDNKILIPLLLKCSYFLNLDVGKYLYFNCRWPIKTFLFNFKCRGK